ncbi:ABC transporter substrate-binding protein [Streptomyces sp. NPDC056983]|uniref:ABC transporter substrate-binding protein n=1 Tax=Streptomyces sp. NPDC056983 TaxID=3345987 RepID=UPI00362D9F26
MKVHPDLATDLGTPSDNAKTWKFTLKDGLKFEDGTPIDSEVVKFGIERAWDPDGVGSALPEGTHQGAGRLQGPVQVR